MILPEAASAAGAPARLWRLVTETWRSLDGRAVLVIVALLLAYTALQMVSRLDWIFTGAGWQPPLNFLLSAELNGLAVIFAIRFAEQACASRPFRWLPYVLAVVVGATVGTSLAWLLTQQVLGFRTAFQGDDAFERLASFTLRHFTHAFPVCGMATIVYVARRRTVQRQEALYAAQRDRSRTERQLVESQLAAMQARIEPRFLLDALARVERLYEKDTGAGDRMLHELARYLRAAIPRMRNPESTLRKEIDLGEAYLTVVAGPHHARLIHATGDSRLDHARLPPMLVLPLLEHALSHTAGTLGSRRHSISIEALRVGTQLRITIQDSAAGFAPGSECVESIRLLRERLGALYGDAARLTFQAQVCGSRAIVEIPHER